MKKILLANIFLFPIVICSFITIEYFFPYSYIENYNFLSVNLIYILNSFIHLIIAVPAYYFFKDKDISLKIEFDENITIFFQILSLIGIFFFIIKIYYLLESLPIIEYTSKDLLCSIGNRLRYTWIQNRSDLPDIYFILSPIGTSLINSIYVLLFINILFKNVDRKILILNYILIFIGIFLQFYFLNSKNAILNIFLFTLVFYLLRFFKFKKKIISKSILIILFSAILLIFFKFSLQNQCGYYAKPSFEKQNQFENPKNHNKFFKNVLYKKNDLYIRDIIKNNSIVLNIFYYATSAKQNSDLLFSKIEENEIKRNHFLIKIFISTFFKRIIKKFHEISLYDYRYELANLYDYKKPPGGLGLLTFAYLDYKYFGIFLINFVFLILLLLNLKFYNLYILTFYFYHILISMIFVGFRIFNSPFILLILFLYFFLVNLRSRNKL